MHGIDILVRDGEIAEIDRGLSGEDVIDCSDKIALPGLINCHTHTPQIFARGWSDDKPLFPWLEANNRLVERADRTVKRPAGRLSAVLMLETGTTTLNDMWNTHLVDEFEDVGIRALMGCALAEQDDADRSVVRERTETNRTFVADYRDHPTVHLLSPCTRSTSLSGSCWRRRTISRRRTTSRSTSTCPRRGRRTRTGRQSTE